MELEAVGTITMGDLLLEAFWQIYNLDSLERAFFDAHTATNAKGLRDETNFGGFSDLDANFTSLVDRALPGAFLATFAGLTLIRIDDGNT